MKQDNNSLSHTTYNCKYHIVIVPKYRRAVIYNKLRSDIITIFKTLIERKPGLKLLEGEACLEHIHMLLEIPPKYSVSEIMGYLKSKSTLLIFEKHANLKYKYGNRHFSGQKDILQIQQERMRKKSKSIFRINCRRTNFQIRFHYLNTQTRSRVSR